MPLYQIKRPRNGQLPKTSVIFLFVLVGLVGAGFAGFHYLAVIHANQEIISQSLDYFHDIGLMLTGALIAMLRVIFPSKQSIEANDLIEIIKQVTENLNKNTSKESS